MEVGLTFGSSSSSTRGGSSRAIVAQKRHRPGSNSSGASSSTSSATVRSGGNGATTTTTGAHHLNGARQPAASSSVKVSSAMSGTERSGTTLSSPSAGLGTSSLMTQQRHHTNSQHQQQQQHETPRHQLPAMGTAAPRLHSLSGRNGQSSLASQQRPSTTASLGGARIDAQGNTPDSTMGVQRIIHGRHTNDLPTLTIATEAPPRLQHRTGGVPSAAMPPSSTASLTSSSSSLTVPSEPVQEARIASAAMRTISPPSTAGSAMRPLLVSDSPERPTASDPSPRPLGPGGAQGGHLSAVLPTLQRQPSRDHTEGGGNNAVHPTSGTSIGVASPPPRTRDIPSSPMSRPGDAALYGPGRTPSSSSLLASPTQVVLGSVRPPIFVPDALNPLMGLGLKGGLNGTTNARTAFNPFSDERSDDDDDDGARHEDVFDWEEGESHEPVFEIVHNADTLYPIHNNRQETTRLQPDPAPSRLRSSEPFGNTTNMTDGPSVSLGAGPLSKPVTHRTSAFADVAPSVVATPLTNGDHQRRHFIEPDWVDVEATTAWAAAPHGHPSETDHRSSDDDVDLGNDDDDGTALPQPIVGNVDEGPVILVTEASMLQPSSFSALSTPVVTTSANSAQHHVTHHNTGELVSPKLPASSGSSLVLGRGSEDEEADRLADLQTTRMMLAAMRRRSSADSSSSGGGGLMVVGAGAARRSSDSQPSDRSPVDGTFLVAFPPMYGDDLAPPPAPASLAVDVNGGGGLKKNTSRLSFMKSIGSDDKLFTTISSDTAATARPSASNQQPQQPQLSAQAGLVPPVPSAAGGGGSGGGVGGSMSSFAAARSLSRMSSNGALRQHQQQSFRLGLQPKSTFIEIVSKALAVKKRQSSLMSSSGPFQKSHRLSRTDQLSDSTSGGGNDAAMHGGGEEHPHHTTNNTTHLNVPSNASHVVDVKEIGGGDSHSGDKGHRRPLLFLNEDFVFGNPSNSREGSYEANNAAGSPTTRKQQRRLTDRSAFGSHSNNSAASPLVQLSQRGGGGSQFGRNSVLQNAAVTDSMEVDDNDDWEEERYKAGPNGLGASFRVGAARRSSLTRSFLAQHSGTGSAMMGSGSGAAAANGASPLRQQLRRPANRRPSMATLRAMEYETTLFESDGSSADDVNDDSHEISDAPLSPGNGGALRSGGASTSSPWFGNRHMLRVHTLPTREVVPLVDEESNIIMNTNMTVLQMSSTSNHHRGPFWLRCLGCCRYGEE